MVSTQGFRFAASQIVIISEILFSYIFVTLVHIHSKVVEWDHPKKTYRGYATLFASLFLRLQYLSFQILINYNIYLSKYSHMPLPDASQIHAILLTSTVIMCIYYVYIFIPKYNLSLYVSCLHVSMSDC